MYINIVVVCQNFVLCVKCVIDVFLTFSVHKDILIVMINIFFLMIIVFSLFHSVL